MSGAWEPARLSSSRWANGSLAGKGNWLSSTCLLKGFGYQAGLVVVTPELVVELMGSACKLIEPGKRTEMVTRGNAYQREDRVFLEAIRSGDSSQIRSSYADAVKSLAVSLAANESYQTGRPVTMKV